MPLGRVRIGRRWVRAVFQGERWVRLSGEPIQIRDIVEIDYESIRLLPLPGHNDRKWGNG